MFNSRNQCPWVAYIPGEQMLERKVIHHKDVGQKMLRGKNVENKKLPNEKEARLKKM